MMQKIRVEIRRVGFMQWMWFSIYHDGKWVASFKSEGVAFAWAQATVQQDMMTDYCKLRAIEKRIEEESDHD